MQCYRADILDMNAFFVVFELFMFFSMVTRFYCNGRPEMMEKDSCFCWQQILVSVACQDTYI